MRKSTLVILVTLVASIFVIPTLSDRDPVYFGQWRPTSPGFGCHDFGIVNTHVTGSVIFDNPMINVLPGENFTVIGKIANFNGRLVSNDMLIGFNPLDADNGLFLEESTADYLTIDDKGDSTGSFSVEMTAPTTPGAYTLLSYGVSGSTSYFDYVTGYVSVIVSEGVAGSGYVDGVVNHLAAIAEPALGGLRWAETETSAVYKPGMINGTGAIGNFMLDIYEERVRSSLFLGLNNEETQLPLDLAVGAGDWIVAIASQDVDGIYWYKTYDETNTNSTNIVHLPFYEGVAGISSYLGRLYRITHNATYLSYAEDALTYLMNTAYTTNGYAWSEDAGKTEADVSTRWSKGTPGIASVFLEFYRLTGNSVYRDVAMGAYTYLDSSKLTNTDGAYWRQFPAIGTSGIYIGRWHGVAGVASFLIDLYEVTGDAGAKTLAISAMDYVVGQQEDDAQGGIWWENAVGSGEHQSGWSRGGAGIGSVLLRADRLDASKNYIDLMDEIYDHYVAFADTTGAGWMWADAINTNDDALSQYRLRTSIGHGAAGIGVFFLEAYQATGEVKWRKAAEMVAIALNDRSFSNADGISWNKGDTETYVDHYLYYGITGIAAFFLEYDVKGDYDTYILGKQAANYIMGQAEADGNNLKWVEKAGGDYKTGVLKGAAGNALQLMQMYQKEAKQIFFGGITTNASYAYLDTAMKGMDWVESTGFTLNGGMVWYEQMDASNVNTTNSVPTGYYGGAAGIADVFIRLSQATGDQSYLAVAESTAAAFDGTAEKTTGYEFAEDFYKDQSSGSTRWSKGGPGIGSFLINLWQQTGTQLYLDMAKGIATWLDATANSDANGNYWYKDSDVDTTGVYLGRWHGVAGVANFYFDLGIALGDETYTNKGIDAMDYVIAQTIVVDDTASWRNVIALEEVISGWSRGSAGIGSVLLRGFMQTGNSTYLDYVKMALNWYEANAVAGVDGWTWEDTSVNTRLANALGHGTAGVIVFATEVYQILRLPAAYNTMAKGVAYLTSIATISGTTATWPKSDLTSEQYIPSTMYYGVSGIAYALTEASSFVNLAPTLKITAGAVVNKKVDVTIEFGDDLGIELIEVAIDAGTPTAIDIVSGDSYTVDGTSLAAGAHTAKITVTDFAGLKADEEFTFIIPADPTTSVTTTDEPTSEEPGFLPISFVPMLLAFIAIPILIRRKK